MMEAKVTKRQHNDNRGKGRLPPPLPVRPFPKWHKEYTLALFCAPVIKVAPKPIVATPTKTPLKGYTLTPDNLTAITNLLGLEPQQQQKTAARPPAAPETKRVKPRIGSAGDVNAHLEGLGVESDILRDVDIHGHDAVDTRMSAFLGQAKGAGKQIVDQLLTEAATAAALDSSSLFMKKLGLPELDVDALRLLTSEVFTLSYVKLACDLAQLPDAVASLMINRTVSVFEHKAKALIDRRISGKGGPSEASKSFFDGILKAANAAANTPADRPFGYMGRSAPGRGV